MLIKENIVGFLQFTNDNWFKYNQIHFWRETAVLSPSSLPRLIHWNLTGLVNFSLRITGFRFSLKLIVTVRKHMGSRFYGHSTHPEGHPELITSRTFEGWIVTLIMFTSFSGLFFCCSGFNRNPNLFLIRSALTTFFTLPSFQKMMSVLLFIVQLPPVDYWVSIVRIAKFNSYG